MSDVEIRFTSIVPGMEIRFTSVVTCGDSVYEYSGKWGD